MRFGAAERRSLGPRQSPSSTNDLAGYHHIDEDKTNSSHIQRERGGQTLHVTFLATTKALTYLVSCDETRHEPRSKIPTPI